MNSNDEQTQQQQILFTEHALRDQQRAHKQSPDHDGKQVIFNNQDYVAIDEATDLPALSDEPMAAEGAGLIKKSRPRWLWRIIFTLLSVVITVDISLFFLQGFVHSPIITSIYAIIFACLLILTSASVFREWSMLREFKHREKLTQQAADVLMMAHAGDEPTPNLFDVAYFCQKISQNLPGDVIVEQEQAWQDALNAGHTDSELLQLYSRLLLTPVDEKALSQIAKFSTEAVVLVALSPVAFIDMLIVLWRNLRMINKIAGLYGLKLGYYSRIKLLKQVFVNMVYAGASELVADFGTDLIGADLLGKLSGRLAQGLGAGMLTARLGLKTMALCRPIPLDEKPKLGDVRREMLSTITNLISKKK